jgi:hypothetical protein
MNWTAIIVFIGLFGLVTVLRVSLPLIGAAAISIS